MIYKFTEVLNDLVNYFILGDILLLESWKRANNLSDDLATEFTTNESGDRAFSEGIVIPMSGIETILIPYCLISLVINRSCAKGKADCSLEGVVIPSKWIIICLCFLHGTY